MQATLCRTHHGKQNAFLPGLSQVQICKQIKQYQRNILQMGTISLPFVPYALNAPFKLRSGATYHQLTRAMRGHILKQTELVGTYSRL